MSRQQSKSQERVIRVFVSSTFSDMQAEREELVKHVFPELKRLCERRRVVLSEVDLRWGITDEAVSAGQVLPICLAEIDNCRPYFIGLLGERYGLVLDHFPSGLSENASWGWLRDHSGKSIAELEMRHGALNSSPLSTRAFFYFRDPGYIDRLPAEADRKSYVSADPGLRHKLDRLKETILESGFPVRRYSDPVSAGQTILADFTELIERLYPEPLAPGREEEEAAYHDAWAESRSRISVGLFDYFSELERYVSGSGPPLVIVGDSGSGKSTLLAGWAQRRTEPARAEGPAPDGAQNRITRRLSRLFGGGRQQARKEDYLFAHFVGATSQSADWAATLRRIMAALKKRFELNLEIPDRADRIPLAFTNWLQAVAARARLVLILDGLDQMESPDDILERAWLPEAFPPNVRLIVSTNRGKIFDELRRRGWDALEINPLKRDERERLSVIYLEQYSKKLSPALLKQVSSARQVANPLYLRTLLEELRVLGRHDQVGERLDYYLTAASTESLFAIMLRRLEQDYEARRPGLVRDVMRYLWASSQGLSESEMLDLLGDGGSPLPGAIWSPLYLALRESLVSRSGLYGFFHRDLRTAVERQYLSGDSEKEAAHRAVADYFALDTLSLRSIDELPWQFAALKSWAELAALLSNPHFLGAALKTHKVEIKSYWSMIESNSNLRLIDFYQPFISAPDEHSEFLWSLSQLLSDTGHTNQAYTLIAHLEARARAESNLEQLRAALNLRGVLLKRRGLWREAKKIFEEEERLCRQVSDLAALSASLGNQAVILQEQGLLNEALALHREEEQICRDLQNRLGLSASMGNQAIILQAQRDLPGARALLCEQELICRQLGDLSGLQKSLGNQANLLSRQGDLERAIQTYQEEEKLCLRLHDPAALQACLGNQASVYEELGDYDRALDLLEAKERICRNELNDPAGLARTLAQQARLFAEKLRQPAHALHLAEEADSLAAGYELTQLRQPIAELLAAIRAQLR